MTFPALACPPGDSLQSPRGAWTRGSFSRPRRPVTRSPATPATWLPANSRPNSSAGSNVTEGLGCGEVASLCGALTFPSPRSERHGFLDRPLPPLLRGATGHAVTAQRRLRALGSYAASCSTAHNSDGTRNLPQFPLARRDRPAARSVSLEPPPAVLCPPLPRSDAGPSDRASSRVGGLGFVFQFPQEAVLGVFCRLQRSGRLRGHRERDRLATRWRGRPVGLVALHPSCPCRRPPQPTGARERVSAPPFSNRESALRRAVLRPRAEKGREIGALSRQTPSARRRLLSLSLSGKKTIESEGSRGDGACTSGSKERR